MKTAMYLFANTGLGMSPGKLAAQVTHAGVNAFRLSDAKATASGNRGVLHNWLNKGYTKLVMEARDTEHLLLIERTLRDKGYAVSLIIDEGRTEIAPQSATALGVEVVDREDEQVQFDFADFRTLKAKAPSPPPNKLIDWLRRS